MDAGASVIGFIVLIACILVALTVHEAVHAYVGFLLGDTTAAEQGRISLNPLRHIDPFSTVLLPAITLLLFHAPILAARPVPFNPSRVRFGEMGAALIAVAGPVSNFVMAVLAALLLQFQSMPPFVAGILFTFLSLNVLLGIFNLVPIPPLDGSRVLYAFAPEPLQHLMAAIEPYGFYIVLALVLLGGFGGALVGIDQAVINFLCNNRCAV